MKTIVIADIAQAHDGSLGILHSYIDAIAETGVDVIKFQTHIADAESSEFEPFRIEFSYVDKTRYDYWKRMELPYEKWVEIKKHCDEKNLEFMSTPFSNEAVDLLERLNVNRYKVGSGEITNHLLLEKIARTGKDIILSSGMSDYKELDAAINLLRSFKNKLSILQCSSLYPTGPENVGLNIIVEMNKRYNLPIGLSDHSGAIYPSIAAVALGAKIIEIHAVFDKRMFGPDSTSSLTVSEIKRLVDGIRFIEKGLMNPIDKNDIKPYLSIKKIFEKTLAVNKHLNAGTILSFEDLEAKKPYGYGISANEYKKVIGRRLKNNKSKFEYLKEEDLI